MTVASYKFPLSPRPSRPAPPPVATVALRGVPFHRLTEPQCIAHILDSLDAGRGGWVVTANADILRQCVKKPTTGELLRQADLFIADGMPIVWASKLQNTPLPERVAGSSLITTLTAAAAARRRSIYLLGGDPGAADAAARVLTGRYPGLRIAGTYCPPFGFERDEAQMQRIATELKNAQPDIVFVGLGCPKQERLITAVRHHLPAAWWMGVGISFSFVSGRVRRAPRWVQKVGLEWVHRMVQEPRRLVKRYVIDDIPFVTGLLARSLMRRWWGGSSRSTTEESRPAGAEQMPS